VVQFYFGVDTLKEVVGELGAIGRNLNQMTRAVNQGARVTGPGRRSSEPS